MKMTWHHPNYYKKLRAERKKIPVSGMENRETGSSGIKVQAPRSKSQAHNLRLYSKPEPSSGSQASSDKR